MCTPTPPDPEAHDGGPLAVCVNDCQLDYGQPGAELARICFQVCCAFAEMRWGPAAAASFTPAAAHTDAPDVSTSDNKDC